MSKENEVVVVEETYLPANSLENLSVGGSTRHMYTTLTDKKQIFNLDNECDYKINDYKGKIINMVDVLIKVYIREEQNVDNETGEITTEYNNSKVCIIIDSDGKSYVTGSKMFTNKMIDFLRDFGAESIKQGVEIEITEVAVKNSSNKALSFKLV